MKDYKKHELLVEKLCRDAGHEVDTQVPYWSDYKGKDSFMDIVLDNNLAIECKFQKGTGTADEKFPYVLQECFKNWGKGIIVVDGSWWDEGQGLNIVTYCKTIAHEWNSEVLYLEEFKERVDGL